MLIYNDQFQFVEQNSVECPCDLGASFLGIGTHTEIFTNHIFYDIICAEILATQVFGALRRQCYRILRFLNQGTKMPLRASIFVYDIIK